MSVDPPGLQRPIHDEVVAGTPHVIHDFITASLLDCSANTAAQLFQNFGPGGSRPLACSARATALHRVENAVRVVNLVDGGRAFGTQAAAAGRMLGIAFELIDLSSCLINVGEQSAGGLAVEANRGH